MVPAYRMLVFILGCALIWCTCQYAERDAACATDCLSKGFKPAECKELCQ